MNNDWQAWKDLADRDNERLRQKRIANIAKSQEIMTNKKPASFPVFLFVFALAVLFLILFQVIDLS